MRRFGGGSAAIVRGAAQARRPLAAKAGMAQEMSLQVNECGEIDDTLDRHNASGFRT